MKLIETELIAFLNFCFVLTGWQESFDSSIVTESHYDASFESEIPPMRSSLERAETVNAAISTSATNTGNGY